MSQIIYIANIRKQKNVYYVKYIFSDISLVNDEKNFLDTENIHLLEINTRMFIQNLTN